MGRVVRGGTVVAACATLAGLSGAPTPLAGQQVAPWCDPGEPAADAPAGLRQFDFLIGRHDIALHAWTGSGWTPPRPVGARWNGWWGLEGRAVYDEWIDPDTTGGRPPSRGVNVRLYDEAEDRWTMMWVAEPGRTVQDLRAELRDGRLTMWQVHPERRGWKAEFERLEDGRWARTAFLQDEASGAWTPQFRLVATPVPCAG